MSRKKASEKPQKTIFADEYKAMVAELIKVRKQLKLTQTDVVRKAGWPDHTYLSKIETRERRLDVLDLARLAKIYGKSTEYFMAFLKSIPINE